MTETATFLYKKIENWCDRTDLADRAELGHLVVRRTRAYASTPRRAAAQRQLAAALNTLFVCRLVSNGEDLLRSLQPEASFMVGNETVLIGGVTNNATNYAFKNASEPLKMKQRREDESFIRIAKKLTFNFQSILYSIATSIVD